MAPAAAPSRHRRPSLSPVVVDALLAYLVAMAVGVAMVTSQPVTTSPAAYAFAVGFGLVPA